MLKILRKKGVMKRLLWVIAVIIIISFGFLGQAYLLSNGSGANYAGKAFGKKISFEEFDQNYKMTQVQAMIQYGDQFQKIREFLDIPSQTWDRIVLLKEAERRRVRVTDDEIVKAIQDYAFFKRDGKFDRLLYDDILKFVFRLKPREFEEGIRQSLKIEKLLALETKDFTVSEEAIFEAYKKVNEKVQISYVLIPAEQFKGDVVFDETQAKDFFKEHRAEFVMPLMVNVDYISFAIPEDATEDQKDKTFEDAIEIANAIKTPEDFDRIAREKGLPIQSSGLFSKEQPNLKIGWPFTLIQRIFEMNVGQVEGPVETLQGFQILRIAEKRKSYIPTYAEAETQVNEAWVKHKAKSLAKEKALQVHQNIRGQYDSFKVPDFAAIAKGFGLELHQTPVFNRGQYLPVVGLSKDFQETAFALSKENPLSGVTEAEKGYCILHLDSHVPVDRADFEKEKNKFAEEVAIEKRAEVFSDYITYLRLKAELEDNVTKNTEGPAS